MTLKGHFDGKVVVLDEPTTMEAGTPVEVSLPQSEAPWEEKLARAEPGALIQHPSGVWLRKGGSPADVLNALREIWSSQDNSWRGVGDDYAARLREKSQTPRYMW